MNGRVYERKGYDPQRVVGRHGRVGVGLRLTWSGSLNLSNPERPHASPRHRCSQNAASH